MNPNDGMISQERSKMSFYSNRAHARASATMRNTESLVQIYMGNIGSNFGRISNTHLSIQVGPVHINLAAIIMYDLAYLFNCLFVYAMGGRVGNHYGC